MTPSLLEALSARAGAAFAAMGLDPALGRVIRSDRPDLAPYQCNGALAAAKAAKRNPREIAAALSEALRADPLVAGAEIAGPGFVNIAPAAEAVAARARALAADAAVGARPAATPLKIVVDYAGPNVAKPMHVGHIRSTIIGDALKRLARALGHQVWGDAHFGDWGFQMGLLIVAVEDEKPELPYFAAGAAGPFPETSPVTLEDLERLYPAYSRRIKKTAGETEDGAAAPNPDFDPALLERARKATAELQAGRPGYRALWRHFVAVSRVALEREFSALGVAFDLWLGESDADPLIPEMVEDLKARGLAVPDQGALVVHVAEEGEKRALPPLIVVSSEGSAMYGTTDLATILDRKRRFDPDLVLYVVDQRQADHFEQVFRASDRARYLPRTALEHVGFGTMNGPDGKPFKTRAGGVLKLADLIAMALEKARARLAEAGLGADADEAEFEDIARKVALAALKFADLQNMRTTNYVFDLDRFTSFEGKTGPYLLYQAVRVKSLLRKAAEEGAAPGPIAIGAAEEAALVYALDAYGGELAQAFDRRYTHIICEHAYALAQAFAKFYAACPVLAAPDETVRAARLGLAALTLKQLEAALGILGIETPERM